MTYSVAGVHPPNRLLVVLAVYNTLSAAEFCSTMLPVAKFGAQSCVFAEQRLQFQKFKQQEGRSNDTRYHNPMHPPG
jgi:hypothetical protein